MPKEPGRFVPQRDSWVWDVLDPKFDVPVAWLRKRFSFVAEKLKEGQFSRDAAIVPALGPSSKLASVEVSGGRDATFVLVYAREVPANWMPGFQESLTYRSDVAGTDLIYDLTGEFMQGKARPFLADFRQLPLRLYAVLPFQLERIDLAAQQQLSLAAGSDSIGFEIPVRVRFLDGRDEPISAQLPYCMKLRHSAGDAAGNAYLHTGSKGESPTTFHAPLLPVAGRWNLAIRSLLTGDEATLPFEVSHVAGKIESQAVSLTGNGLQIRHAPEPVKLGG